MINQYEKSTQCIKWLAKLNTTCNSIAALVTVLRFTEISNVDAVIKYNSDLITKLQEIQRALLYFKNTPQKAIAAVPPEPPKGTA